MRISRRCAVSRAAIAIVFALSILCTAPLPAAPSAEEQQVYFDELFSSLLEEKQIPGLAAVLVQDGRIVLRAGYGLADRSRQMRVDPERTLFPLGSISKLLTTVAVLQLVEKDTLELDSDIVRYLGPIQVDHRFHAPVTLRHLLTHTDGFDVRWLFGGAARVPDKVRPLAEFLAELPPRAMPPGEVYLYSDVGMALAGYIVERVSDVPFAEYMERHVFAPLEMQRTSFRPDRKFYARERATGYDYDRHGVLQPVPIVYPHATPASGVTGPVADLGPLMIALLQSDQRESAPLLGPSWVREMGQRQFTHHPAIPGTGFGFYEYVHHGRRALVHGGLLPGFTTVIVLVPDVGVGLCVAANRFDLIGPLENDLLIKILDRFAPAAQPPAAPAAIAGAHPGSRSLAGTYRCDQYSRFSLDKVLVVAGLATELRVEDQPDGNLLFHPGGGRWREIEPLLFEREETGDRVVFQTDSRGQGTRILGSAQFMSYHRIGPWDNYLLHGAIAGVLGLLSCTGAIYAIRDRFRSRWDAGIPSSTIRRWLRVVGAVLPLALVAFAVGLLATMGRLDFATAAFGEPPALALLRCVPLALGLAAAVHIVVAVVSLRTNTVSRWEVFAHIVAGGAVLLLLPVLNLWNLMCFPFSVF